jgi:hypothetical protein
MSTTTSIFAFDHGQKKLSNAIGVTDAYMDDMQEAIKEALKNYLFDDDRNVRDSASPSELVEMCLHNFSYNQLVLMSSFYLQDRLEGFAKKVERMATSAKKLSLNADDLPDNIREFFENHPSGEPIDGDSLPPDVKDFLKSLTDDPTDND